MDNMTFEQAEELLTAAQKDRIARCLWKELRLPEGLNGVEKAFAFGLYTFVEYEDKGALRQYFMEEEEAAQPEEPAPEGPNPPLPERGEMPVSPAPQAPLPPVFPESTRPGPCMENLNLLENKHTESVGISYTQVVPETPAAPAPKAPAAKTGERPAYPFIKNIPHESVQELGKLVSVQPGQIISRTLAQNPAVSLTLFAFAEGEEISAHSSEGDALVQVLEGEGQFTVDGADYLLQAGQVLVMPAGKPHAVYAPRPFKMLLTVVFPPKK